MGLLRSISGFCLSLALARPTTSSQVPPPVAHTLNGSYYGIHNRHFYQDLFLGIPFAQPPVADLRLRPPTSLNTSWTGSRNATEYGFACIGYGEDTFIGGHNYVDENCLTLNVVRPSGYEGRKLPVGVWIYGFVPYRIYRKSLNSRLEEDGSKVLVSIRDTISLLSWNSRRKSTSLSSVSASTTASLAGDFYGRKKS